MEMNLPKLDSMPDHMSPNGYYEIDNRIIGIRLWGLRLKKIPDFVFQAPYLEKLMLDNNMLEDISGLEKLKNLRELHLSSNILTDIISLKKLKKLELLDLEENHISDISPLAGLFFLKHLYLDNNFINDLQPLTKLVNLNTLFLRYNYISDISPLNTLVNLEVLYIEENLIESLNLNSLTQLTELDIGNNKLSDINGISALVKLESLIISKNPVSNILSIKKLLLLHNLEANFNSLLDISPLAELKNLEQLELIGNSINDLSPLIGLEKLAHLELSSNNINNIEAIKFLPNLLGLSLSENLIFDITPLKNLHRLLFLNLDRNRIKKIDTLKFLLNLQELNISNNRLNNIYSLFNLKNLTKLTLETCNIHDISTLTNLKELHSLELSNNEIRDITPLKNLEKLEEIGMDNNIISILPSEIVETWTRGLINVRLENNPIENVPYEILQEGLDAINIYLKSLDEGSQAINEIKVTLLGEGAAGKTSLMKYLKGEPYDKNEPQTHGINLGDYVSESGVTMKIWDFGGQDIMHHTHQFFLTDKSIYIIVLNARENTDTEKWLKLAQVFGSDSPIIIVTNKIDENPSAHENIKYLNTKYSNLQGRYVRVSCESGQGLEELKQLLIDTITDLLHVRTLWGNSWLGVKQELENIRNSTLKNYIHFEMYEDICDRHSVNPMHRETLIKWLHRLGVITYFADANLSETNVINPSWLTEAFYGIINAKKIADSFGHFQTDDLRTILCSTKYPRQKYSFLLNLMTKFELCYRIDECSYMIPDLLNKEEPDFDFNETIALKFKFKYPDLLPKAILPKLMVRRHQEIKADIRWRTGLVINDANFDSEALIRIDEEDKEISIYVNGEQKRGYLASIISNVDNINRFYKGLEPTKLIPCNCTACLSTNTPHYFSYETLRKSKRKVYPCPVSDEDVSINDLLGVLITKEELEQAIEEVTGRLSAQTKKYLEEGNVIEFISTIKALFGSVSYLLFEKSEKAYHVPLFIFLRSVLGINARADELQSKGRADIILHTGNYIYILELKLDGSSAEAIDQIHEKKYYDPYLLEGKKIMLIGINFTSQKRNISEYSHEIHRR